MLWNSLASARVAISRIWPASSTPVGPPPAMAKVSQPSRSGPGASVSAISKAANSRRRMLSASSRVFIPGAHFANSSWPKYDCRMPAATHQHVVVEVNVVSSGRRAVTRRASASRSNGLAEKGGDVAVARQFLAQRPADLPDAERSGGALVEQRLEDVAGRPVEQRDVDVVAPEAARAEQPAEPATDDQHLRPTVAHRFDSTHARFVALCAG